jgi:valyl-tRNA synthetase
MPFLSEDLWQKMAVRSPEEALIVSTWPQSAKEVNNALLSDFETAQQIVSGVRTIRKEKQIPNKEVLDLLQFSENETAHTMNAVVEKLANLNSVQQTQAPVAGALSFRVASVEYFVPIVGAIDVSAEIKKVTDELHYTQGFLKSVEKKLANERFVSNAPEKVLAMEKKKQSDALAKIETLKQSLVYLKG